ncbi:MAG: MOSC domain-containing protein [Deltaproteobacteria bacterium]|nr:MOSC domain-containing protein [Deltaproteobacteria bacterium]MBW2223325.1 MOSC domain-containing protein [Deltaproteobacteria bacterium]MBW2403634.1 MOSC domain-containing protein [Deltaproteobacteria bacterium]
MKLLSVNVSLPKEVPHKGKMVRTGIFKESVEGRVAARTLNLDGDRQADLVGHGGEMRAVLVYSRENYDYWAKELGRSDLVFGQFGENFTVEGMLDEHIHVGDRFRIGTALFEVSQPRVPCYKLAMKMGVEGFYAQLLKSGRPGFYFRVLEEGDVGAGDEIQLVESDPIGVTVREVSNLLYFQKDDLDGARNALRIKALSSGWVQSFQTRLQKAEAGGKAQEQFRTLVVTQKVPESETITSFYLVPEDGNPLDPFLPGQFLPLKLDIPGQFQPVLRTYSLSDAPQKNYYRLTIKRESAPPNQPDAYPGVSSSYFHDGVEVGTKLLAKAPRGRFVLDPEGETPVVLLSAGVGLTPLISMLNAIVESGSPRPTWFIHGSRNGRVHAMGESVREIARAHDNVHAHTRYSRPAAEDVIGRDYDDQGHVNGDVVQQLIRETTGDCDFYLCGPTPFLKSLFDGLLELGVPEHRIHYEFFGPASALQDRERVSGPKRRAGASECCEEIEVTFSRSRVSAKWNPSLESILDLAEANGLSPDYSCRSGVCQTCMSGLQGGEVEYVLEPLDPPDPGSVLICCSKPKTNVVVDV